MLQGPCPNCNASSSTYFGDILTVKGNREKNEVQCAECTSKLKFDANKRQVSPCFGSFVSSSSNICNIAFGCH